MRTPAYIDAPELLTRRQRTVGAVITAIMWAAYAYLWLPLASLAAWGLGVEFAYDVMVRAGGADALRTALFWYAVLLSDVILTVTFWSRINRWRFANRNRRLRHEPVADGALAHYFGVTTETLVELRAAQRVELDIDVHGRPVIAASAANRRPGHASHRAA